ncbi:MAG: amidase family protein, partial [Ferrovibrionaceae bacterium]
MSGTADLWRLDAATLATLIRNGVVSAREATAAALARLDEVNPALNAVVRPLHAEAMAAADAADRRRATGEALPPLHGRTRNPRSAAHTPGGSSGGAGSAVASGIGAIAHGNDIAGSVRYPAYCNGVLGLRPTYGRIPSFNATAQGRATISASLMAVQ